MRLQKRIQSCVFAQDSKSSGNCGFGDIHARMSYCCHFGSEWLSR